MRIIEFSPDRATPIELFNSVATSSVSLGAGAGEAHVYCLYFGPDSHIGPHHAGFGQLFLVMNGAGWAAGADGRRARLTAGQGAFFARGELHSKGSENGMTVIMVQVTELEPASTNLKGKAND
jgi:quercetin dioxygenase-like cupin family protein